MNDYFKFMKSQIIKADYEYLIPKSYPYVVLFRLILGVFSHTVL